MKKLIERINELAHKNKTQGLTQAEQEEREKLRQEYLAKFRQNFTDILDNTVIMEADGTKTKVKRIDKK